MIITSRGLVRLHDGKPLFFSMVGTFGKQRWESQPKDIKKHEFKTNKYLFLQGTNAGSISWSI